MNPIQRKADEITAQIFQAWDDWGYWLIGAFIIVLILLAGYVISR